MDPYREIKYSNPPIVEVVVEFRFVPSEPWDLTVPGLVYDRVRTRFPQKRLLKVLEGETAAEASQLRQEFRLTDRMQFLREDEKAFVQVGPDLLAVNHLAPYPTWEGFRPLIQDALQAYVAVTQPKGLRRIGLRYINRIVIPANPVELADYLNFRPFLGAGLPQKISDFILGLQSPYQEGRDVLRLQLMTDEPRTPDSVALILDMDYFMAHSEGVPLQGALDWIETAHLRVQEAFEACITDRLRVLFNA
ncbi:MAG: TIGR04255 family protein [Anaerolineae bacterium]|nr:TIGR04255 family protein [Anaerolineae bacterium]